MLKAFLVTKLNDSELEQFKRAFEKGAKVHLRPMMHLKIIQAAKDYLKATHAQIRKKENDAGNTDPFIVIDHNHVDKGAVWYEVDFADEDDVENGFAESEAVLMRALVLTEQLAISHVCWQQGNPPMGEEFEALDIVPLRKNYEQSDPVGADHESDDEDEMWSTDEIEVIAEAGEYETTTDLAVRSNMSPMPDEAVRLIPAIAQREKLISEWTSPEEPEHDKDDDSESSAHDDSQEDLPAGSIRFAAKYDPNVPRIQYQWPEGSL